MEPSIVTAGTEQLQIRYYAIDDRPVKVESSSSSGVVAHALDLTTGAFGPDHAMLGRIASADKNVEEMSEPMFQRLVAELRRSASYDRQNSAMAWFPTGDPEYPYKAELGGTVYIMYSGDFPVEPMYSLLVDGQVVDNLDSWPRAWIREAASIGSTNAAD
jgi:hypothetical protein